MLGIVGHWANALGESRSGLLALRRVVGSHTGENQCSHLWDVIQSYGIENKVGYFTCDNAPNNDTALNALQQRLAEKSIRFNPIKRRLRCFGYIMNLVAKAFLYGSQDDLDTLLDANTSEVGAEDGKDREKEVVNFWRKRGSLGKLKNLILSICQTPQRREQFASLINLAQGSEKASASHIHRDVHTRELH